MYGPGLRGLYITKVLENPFFESGASWSYVRQRWRQTWANLYPFLVKANWSLPILSNKKMAISSVCYFLPFKLYSVLDISKVYVVPDLN